MVASGTNSPRRRRKLEDKLKALLQQGFGILVDKNDSFRRNRPA
jgi:hypothetical protein